MNIRARHYGYTIVELLIVIVVIGILATMVITGYNTVVRSAHDKALLSDLDALDGIEAEYGLRTNTAGKAWYSGTGIDASLNFTPSKGNVIDVVIGLNSYCIRAYNPAGSKKSITDAYMKESQPGACTTLVASAAAQAAGGGFGGWATLSAAQGDRICGLSAAMEMYCWGYNINDDYTPGATLRPTLMADATSGALSGKTIQKMSVGGGASNCVISNESLAYCWGDNTTGELGNNNSPNASLTPVAVSTAGVLGGKTVTDIATTNYRSCVIASGQVICWGFNNSGQAGDNRTSVNNSPSAMVTTGVLSGKTAKALSVGLDHTCVIASDDLLYCAGLDYYGELGDGTANQQHITPVAVNTTGLLSGKTIKSVTAGRYHTCAIASDNKAYCWGRNNYGQLGNNSTTQSAMPVAVNTSGVLSGKTIQSISAGSNHTCVVTTENKAYCWGRNNEGQLGDATTTNRLTPVAVSTYGPLASDDVASIYSAGSDGDTGNFTCAIGISSAAYCWGANAYGELGDGSTDSSLEPVQVLNP